jgi:hypothetical protein
MRYDSRHRDGKALADALLAVAATSVSQYHGEPYRLQIRYAREGLDLWWSAILSAHTVGQPLTAIPSIGSTNSRRSSSEWS